MFKSFTLFIFLATALFAERYPFSELRYTDAIGRSVQLNGEINFTHDGLIIKYPKKATELVYDGESIVYMKNGKESVLKARQESKLMRYFDILKTLHEGDESELKSHFEITKSADMTLLKPTGTIKYYINKIKLIKEGKQLRYVKFFLKNNDYITIHIDDEIR